MANIHTTLTSLFSDIADKIREKTGGTDKIVADNFPDAISNIPIDGIDTSDATALASDIAQGKTAYANGVKVVGTVETTNSGQSETLPAAYIELSDYSNTLILCKSLVKKDVLLRTGSYANAYPYKSDFGNATAVDVVAGKTFTSSAGLKVTGSMADNGAVTKTLDSSTTSYTVPAGYHNGSGKVNISTETKTATPTTGSQTVTPSSGKVLSKVTVNAIPSQYVDTSDATATADDIAKGKTAYVNGIKVTGSIKEVPSIVKYDPVVAETLVVSDSSGGVPNPGKDGIYIGLTSHIEESDGKNIVSPGTTLEQVVDPAEFGDATASDVVSGKTFTSAAGLKVTGTHECAGGTTPTLQSKTVTPSESEQTISPDSGYDGLSSVTVEAVSNTYVGSGVTKKAAQTITPGTADQTLAAGQYLIGAQTIKGDANLLAGNIKSGVSIFGVTGSHEGSSGGIDTSDATATSGDILSGKTAYVNGSKVTGSIAAKSASDITASGKTVTVPAGYYASSANKSVETATQATPTISVDNSGKITATSEQSGGYVTAGTKSATKQLSTQAAQTITPGTEDKTIASGKYLTGDQTIKGDSNLLASNIKSGVSIFGVSGSYSGSSGGGSLTSKSGTITTSSFDTGFSEIVAIIIDKVSVNHTGMAMASFIPIIGKGTISGCSSYNTYMKQYASKISSNSCNVEGGTFNWVDTNATYAFKEGDSYYWYAIGYE